MHLTTSTILQTIAAGISAARRVLTVLAGFVATQAGAVPSSGAIIPIGCLEIRESGPAIQMVLLDDADEAVSELTLHVTDDSIAGALLSLPYLPRGSRLTVEPVERPAGDVRLFNRGHRLVIQPPLIGETDAWTLQLRAPTAHAGVTAIVATVMIEVDHREANHACDAASPCSGPCAGGSTFDPSLIVIRIKPLPMAQPIEEWPY
jgi:hypothetical protein